MTRIEKSELEKMSLLRPEDVAEVLNVSKSLVYKLIQQKQIPAIKFNRTVRVRQTDLSDYITKCLTSDL